MKCITPFTAKDKENQSIPVDCGKCPNCIKKRTSQWSFRLRKEGDNSSSSYFITLTYNTIHIPITKNGYMTLKPEDITKWIKRLRKVNKEKIKYYYVGEYGGQTNRPHYHMIIYNADINLIDKTWNLGAIHYGEVNGASIGYTLKYMIKDSRIPMHKNDDRLPEFGRMSKGLGAQYLTDNIIQWHQNQAALLTRLCCMIDGKKIPMPRYYKEKIYSEAQKWLIQLEAKKLSEKNMEEREKTVILHNEIEAHKALFRKQQQSKYKNKYL